jgi:hypothetical protein
MKALLVLVLILGARLAHADDFAQPVANIDDIVWAVTAKCDAGDDTEQRQCRAVRDAAQKRYAGQTLLVDADPAAFTIGTWNAQKRSVAMKLASPRSVGSGTLYDNAKTFPDEATAIKFIKTVRKVRVQLLVKLAAKPALPAEVTGYRVVVPCDGEVVIAKPASGPTWGPLAPDKTACVP